jgi:hypothetical protein
MVQPGHTPELILWEDSKLNDSGIRFLPCPTTLRYVMVSAPCPLNAWCELPVENLSGRCSQTRVGLLPDPEGKGTELLWSI